MSQVTLTLKDLSRAPWGLFTNTEPAIRIVWLTHIQPTAVLDRSLLSEMDVERISNAVRLGFLDEKGLDLPRQEVKTTSTMREDLERISKAARGPSTKDQILTRYPQINDILEGHHNTVKKRLKNLAAQGTGLRFFLDCKEIEMKRDGGPRNSVLNFILDVIEIKTTEVTSDKGIDRITGASLLSEAYYQLIDESDDDD